ncbi:tail tape measure protein [Parapedomonas caeni]
MTDILDTLIVQVRADTRAFASDVRTLTTTLDDGLAAGMEAAGRRMEVALDRFVRTGKFGFEDLKRVALSALADIASAQISSALGQLGGLGGGGGWGGIFSTVLSAVGLAGRATGGPVTGGRAYVVGERGPELFVPTAAGRVETLAATPAARPVAITINVAAPQAATPQLMQRSANQVARAVRQALARAG